MDKEKIKKILFWTAAVVVPGGSVLLLIEIARRSKLLKEAKKQIEDLKGKK